jgi:putative transposase
MALFVARRIRSADLMAILADPFIVHGPPARMRSDNGPKFIAIAVKGWLAQIGVQTLCITSGSQWKNGYRESINGSLRDELLNGEMFYSLAETQILIQAWRRHYNTVRPYRSLGYRLPTPEAVLGQCRRPVPLRSTCDQFWPRRSSCTNNQAGLLIGVRSFQIGK